MAFKEPEKANIRNIKANIETEKANIEKTFNPKTTAHVVYLLEIFGFETVFGRSDVQKELGLKPTRCSELLHEKGRERDHSAGNWLREREMQVQENPEGFGKCIVTGYHFRKP